ncbi:adenine phosphoribosyltransferase [Vallicoccus soli]|uniref:Adenine phosphoribosyltransferase n=1 Tax=Vallicoccus soli TaxID=2339232 RepID=A0A3A3ZL34_9ACTN|nr:adenine phosphoribosyltransferase [Vallicoccus soli]
MVRDVPGFPEPGVVFKDIAPLLADPGALRLATEGLAAAGPGADRVVGVEARGFILGAPVALHLGAGFVPVRKKGKLPGATLEAAYALEYGEAVLQLQEDALVAGHRVLLVDDVLATGGTVEAAVGLCARAGAEVVGVAVLLELPGLGGRERLERAAPGVPLHVLLP